MVYVAFLSLVLILSLSAFFSGSETALMSLNRYRLNMKRIKAIVYAVGSAGDEPGGRTRMLRNVLELGERRVSEVMVPRTQILAVEADTSLGEIVEEVSRTASRSCPGATGPNR